MTTDTRPKGRDWPTVPCPECGWVMRPNCLPKHLRTHGDPRLALAPTLAEQERMVRLYKSGASFREIADATGWSPSECQRVLTAWGVPRRRREGRRPWLTADELLQTAQLYGQGLSISEVADILGLTHTAVRLRLLRAGAQMHPQNFQSRTAKEVHRRRVELLRAKAAQRRSERPMAAA